MSIIGQKKDTIVVMDEFIFAINDQNLENNRIEPSLLMATKVARGDWVTATQSSS